LGLADVSPSSAGAVPRAGGDLPAGGQPPRGIRGPAAHAVPPPAAGRERERTGGAECRDDYRSVAGDVRVGVALLGGIVRCRELAAVVDQPYRAPGRRHGPDRPDARGALAARSLRPAPRPPARRRPG